MIEQFKDLLNDFSPNQQKAVLASIIASAVLMLSVAGFGGYTVVARTVAFNDHTDVTLTETVQTDYLAQIQEALQYDNLEGVRVSDTYLHRGLLYLHIFDGYAEDIFVFQDDELYAFGSTVTSDLLLIEDL